MFSAGLELLNFWQSEIQNKSVFVCPERNAHPLKQFRWFSSNQNKFRTMPFGVNLMCKFQIKKHFAAIPAMYISTCYNKSGEEKLAHGEILEQNNKINKTRRK